MADTSNTYTEGQEELLLQTLKNDLELITDYLDQTELERKNQSLFMYIDLAVTAIKREGISLDLEEYSDIQLVSIYAMWLYEKRKDKTAQMPRMLRYNLNIKLFSQKMGEDS